VTAEVWLVQAASAKAAKPIPQRIQAFLKDSMLSLPSILEAAADVPKAHKAADTSRMRKRAVGSAMLSIFNKVEQNQFHS
jgi:hypothetical protein